MLQYHASRLLDEPDVTGSAAAGTESQLVKVPG